MIFEELSLEDYSKGKSRREGAVNLLSYLVKMTMDTQSLVTFLYHLQDQEGYYFVENMKIIPRGAARGAGPQQLNIETRINTTLVFESKVKAQVKRAAAKAAVGPADKKAKKGALTGFAWLAEQTRLEREKYLKEEEERKQRKWYQFWKYFKKSE